MSKHSVARTIDFTTTSKHNVAGAIVLQRYPPTNVAKHIGFATVRKQHLLKYLTVDIPKKNDAKTNSSINMVFGIVVQPMGLATLFPNML